MMNTRTTRLAVLIASLCVGAIAYGQDFMGGNFMLQDELDAAKRYCLDLEGYAYTTDTSAPVIVHSCKEGFFKDGTWKVDYPQDGQIYLPEYDLCVAAEGIEAEANVVLRSCDETALNRFVFRDDGKVQAVSSSDEGYCLAVGLTSRRTGNNLRRETRMVVCDETEDKYTQWILPREDAVYPAVIVEPAEDGDGPAPGAGARAGPGIGRRFTGACAPCHAPDGNGYQSEFSPKITGQQDWYLRRQLMNFRNDLRGADDSERWAKQMSFHIKDFSPTQLDSFVDYIVTMEDTPAEKTIEGDTTRGERLYAQSCAVCHGEDGMGNEQLNSPRLAGMSDWYMVVQLRKFRSGVRGQHPDDVYGAQMVASAAGLPDDQALTDVVAYINLLAR